MLPEPGREIRGIKLKWPFWDSLGVQFRGCDDFEDSGTGWFWIDVRLGIWSSGHLGF